jgi:predicted nucleic acid-binding protein
MRRVFADTGYWVALLNPTDNLNVTVKTICDTAARRARRPVPP